MKLLAATTLAIGAEAIVGQEGSMHEAFHSLSRFASMWGTKYPADKWTAITDCMATAGSTLYPSASDAAWDGWTQFGITGGTLDDPWSGFPDVFRENDPKNMTFRGHQFPIIEPCNTVSNLAYYRILPELCNNRHNLVMGNEYVNAIIGSFATLGVGSSFMHSSQTHLGHIFDDKPIEVIAYQYLQLMTGSLKVGVEGTDSELHELSRTPRAYDGRVLANMLITIPLDFEIGDWNDALGQLDVPPMVLTFTAIIINIITLLYPVSVADQLIQTAMKLFANALTPEVSEFVTQYVGIIRGAIDFQLTSAEKDVLNLKFIGTLYKLIWAFVWQEDVFKYDFMYSAEWNLIGNSVTSTILAAANGFTNFTHDMEYQSGINVYPGQLGCRKKVTAPHAIWHEVSGSGLMDLAYMADACRAAIDIAQARGFAKGAASSEDDTFVATGVIDKWATDTEAEPWSEAYVARQGFVSVVKTTVNDADSCGSGTADGSITFKELICYMSGIVSPTDSLKGLFDGVKAHIDRAQASSDVVV